MALSDWWKSAVGYQIYPKSFLDTNHDGIGDIEGIREKISYLSDLGINFVWLCPIYKSPGIDNGYDISDYKSIDEQYGDIDELKRLINEFHRNGIKVMMDLVLNHTSVQHEWFLKAKKDINSPYHDYYIWRKGKDEGLPNNWTSLFGGSAWEYNKQTDEYYYHLYAKQQADLNWENKQLRDEMYNIIKFWASQGVDGFRLDAITHLKKLQTFEDVDNPDQAARNIPGIEVFLKELKDLYTECKLVTVGEVGAVAPEDGSKWVNPITGYMDMLFQFDAVNFGDENKFNFETKPLSVVKDKFNQWQKAVENENGTLGLFIENHDLPRAVSYFGTEESEDRAASAKAVGLMYFMMKGIPFIYEGQELGMINGHPRSIEEINDVDSRRYYYEQLASGKNTQITLQQVAFKGRDNARTPMQWSDDNNAGFSDTTPWLKVTDSYKEINVVREDDDKYSVLNFYKKMIFVRRQNPTLISGQFKVEHSTPKEVISYRRTSKESVFLIISNLSNNAVNYAIPSDLANYDYELVLSNNRVDLKQDAFNLAPWGAALVKFDIGGNNKMNSSKKTIPTKQPVRVMEKSNLPKLPISKIWLINFGFLGVQMAFSLQSSNMGRIFQTLGANPNNLGFFFLVPPLAGLIIQPLIGKFSDRTWLPRVGRRIPYLILGVTVAALVLLLLPNAGSFGFTFAQALWFGALTITLLDLSNNISMQPYKMMIADMVEEDQRGLAYSIQGFFSNTGSILASIIPFILTAIGIANVAPKGEVPLSVKLAFYIGASILVLSSLVTILKVKEYAPKDYNRYHHITETDLKDKKSFIQLLKEAPKIFWIVSLIQFFSWFGFQYLWTYATGALATNIWHTENVASAGFQNAGNWYGMMSAVQAVAAVIWSLVLTKVTNKSSKLVYALSLFAGAMGLISIALVHDKYLLVLSFILIGIAWASMHTFPFTLVSNSIDGSNMGAYLGLFNGSICVPQIAASLLSFVLFPLVGSSFPLMIALAGVGMAIGGLIVHFVNSGYFGK